MVTAPGPGLLLLAAGGEGLLCARAEDGLCAFIFRLLASHLERCSAGERQAVKAVLPAVLRRLAACISGVNNKYYRRDGRPYFDPLHTCQNMLFLYFMANEISMSTEGHKGLADKIYYLNKILNCVDIYHEVSLPEVFWAEHPLGSVMGRARYGNRFLFYQGCTVGGNKDAYPWLGDGLIMFSGAKILGGSRIGDHCVIAANAMVKDEEIESGTLVFGSSPALVRKKADQAMFAKYFR